MPLGLTAILVLNEGTGRLMKGDVMMVLAFPVFVLIDFGKPLHLCNSTAEGGQMTYSLCERRVRTRAV